MGEEFHRRGHHVQKAHGRRQFAADGSHLSGGMIALIPSAEDAKRLALPGGEKAADLHCTLVFLGDDGAAWPPDVRDIMEGFARRAADGMTPIKAKVFGAAHWNGGGDNPSWVWNVGDDPGQGLADSSLNEAYYVVGDIIGMAMSALDGDLPEIPPQHSPWAAHICAAYTDDLTLVRALEKRNGPVVFDRIRLSFGDDDRDIPLTARDGALVAAGLRRDTHDHEGFCDFAEHNRQWEGAVSAASNRLGLVLNQWRASLREQLAAGLDTPDALSSLAIDPADAVGILDEAMTGLAQRAGDSMVKEAAKQGVEIPEWSLPDDALTAAVGGRKLLRNVAEATSSLMAGALVQKARRLAVGLLTRQTDPASLAAEVDRTLQEDQAESLRGPVGTAMSTAQTAGRQAVLEAAPPGEYYASEILDKNTCGPCKAVDGEQFSSLEIAIKAYPVMGYKDCVGPKYGNSCRGMIVARWTPEPEALVAHGTKGEAGYELLHGPDKVTTKAFLDESQEMQLREELDKAHYAGFTSREYNAYADPGSHDYDPDDDEVAPGEVNYVEWEGLAQYYASGAGDQWYSDFEGARRIRRAANTLAGLDENDHDRLLGEDEPDDYDRNAALALLTGVATAKPLDRPLYRGSFYSGADPDEVEAQLRGMDGLDFSVASFTDGQGVADYFADPSLYESQGGDASAPGARVMYEVEPGAQGVLGHIFPKNMRAGNSGVEDDEEDADYVESDEALTDFTQDHPREIVTGGHFEIGEIVRDGDTIRVRLRQTRTHPPKDGGQ